MPRRAVIAIVVMAMTALGGVLMTPALLVQVTTEAGDVLACRRALSASTITLAFTHSMYGGDVKETYVPAPGNTLRRVRIVTANAASAEYYAWDGAVERVAGGFEVLAAPLVVDGLPIRVDQVGKHRLRIDDTVYDLATMTGGSAQVTVRVTSRPLVTQVFGPRC